MFDGIFDITVNYSTLSLGYGNDSPEIRHFLFAPVRSHRDDRYGPLPIACDVRTPQDKLLGEVDELLNRWRGEFLANRCHTP